MQTGWSRMAMFWVVARLVNTKLIFMKSKSLPFKHALKSLLLCGLTLSTIDFNAQTLAFPEATGFGRFTTGARGAANPQIYLVTNLNDSGPGSFRDAVSQPGRFVIFKVGGIVNLQSVVAVAANTTIAGQTAPGEGILFLGPRVSFTGANNTIARYMRIRYGGTSQNQDASGIANGANMILDHMTFTWGTDEVFSINWDNNGTSPDNITIQNSIIGQGLHRHNHSAGGLMQPPPGGKISLIGNLYICNKTRNNKIKGINEFVNNVVYNWGNYGNTYGHTQSGEAYIMGGDSAGSSFANIINNYFIGGPNTSNTVATPFSVGNANFNLYGAGNYFDNNKNGVLDGALVPQNLTGYPVGNAAAIMATPYDYPMKTPTLTAQDAFNNIVAGVGASYPKRDQVDSLMISDLMSKGTTATYVYVQNDLVTQFGFTNGGAGHIYGAPAPLDTDNDGMPDAWETANGLNPNVFDALVVSTTHAPYLNIEVYINSLPNTTPPDFIIPPSNLNFTNAATTTGTPASSSLTVNWNDNAVNETNYVLERSTNGTTFTVIATLPANTTTYNETGLTPNTQYYYRVKATNATDSSVYTTNASMTTPPIPSAPTQATNPAPANGNNNAEFNNGNLLLKWAGSTNTTTYSVHFGTDPQNLSNVGTVPYSATPSYQLTNLNPATNYYWRIDASNALGVATGNVWSFRALTPSLVGNWPFAEAPSAGAQIADATSFANHGILDVAYDNVSVRVPGKENNALDLATSPDNMYIASIPHQDHIMFDNHSFSVSYWMKAPTSMIPSSSSTSLYVLCKGSFTANATTGATGKRFNIEIKGGQLRYAIDDNVTKREITSPIANYFTNNWVHVVIQRDVIAHKMRIYTNGVLSAEGDEITVTGIGEASDLIIGNIGELEFQATTAPAPYKGAFDELKMFNYALSPMEISALYNQAVLSNAEFSISKNVGSVYPNPVKDEIFIKLPEYKKSSLTATLMDMTGKVIIKEKINANGNGTFNLNVAGKKVSGNYILNVSGDDLNSNFKIMVQ